MAAPSELSVLKFHCGGCKQRLSVIAGYEGRKFFCPKCEMENHVPGAAPTDLWVNENLIIKLFCQHCGEKLFCGEGAVGREIRCLVCGKDTLVPARRMNGGGTNGGGTNGGGTNGGGTNGAGTNGGGTNGGGTNGGGTNGGGTNGAGTNGAGTNGGGTNFPLRPDQVEPESKGKELRWMPDLEEIGAFRESAERARALLDDIDSDITEPSGERGEDPRAHPDSSPGKSLPAGPENGAINGNEEAVLPDEAPASEKDLFESLKDLGFEVESYPFLRERTPGSDDAD